MRKLTSIYRMSIAGLALILSTISNANGQPIFSNTITGTNPGTFNPYTSGQVVVANITASGIGHGSSNSPAPSGGDNIYNLNGWPFFSADLNSYFTFTITPDAGYNVNFTSFQFAIQATSSQGPNFFELRSSLDGFASNILTGAIATAATGYTADLSAAAFQNIATPITFRIYPSGASGTFAGTGSINDFIFNGEVVSIPLAISLGNISAKNIGNRNLIFWNTYSESGNNRFIVERSNDGKQFTAIGEMDAHGFASDYSFEDQAPVTGINYYRIRMVEDNSGMKLSKVVSVVVENRNNNMEVSAFPNPVKNGELKLQLTSGATSATVIEIMDMSGKLLRKTEVRHNGIHTLDVSTLPAGIYFMTVSNGTEMKSIKISK